MTTTTMMMIITKLCDSCDALQLEGRPTVFGFYEPDFLSGMAILAIGGRLPVFGDILLHVDRNYF